MVNLQLHLKSQVVLAKEALALRLATGQERIAKTSSDGSRSCSKGWTCCHRNKIGKRKYESLSLPFCSCCSADYVSSIFLSRHLMFRNCSVRVMSHARRPTSGYSVTGHKTPTAETYLVSAHMAGAVIILLITQLRTHCPSLQRNCAFHLRNCLQHMHSARAIQQLCCTDARVTHWTCCDNFAFPRHSSHPLRGVPVCGTNCTAANRFFGV